MCSAEIVSSATMRESYSEGEGDARPPPIGIGVDIAFVPDGVAMSFLPNITRFSIVSTHSLSESLKKSNPPNQPETRSPHGNTQSNETHTNKHKRTISQSHSTDNYQLKRARAHGSRGEGEVPRDRGMPRTHIRDLRSGAASADGPIHVVGARVRGC